MDLKQIDPCSWRIKKSDTDFQVFSTQSVECKPTVIFLLPVFKLWKEVTDTLGNNSRSCLSSCGFCSLASILLWLASGKFSPFTSCYSMALSPFFQKFVHSKKMTSPFISRLQLQI
ncbi:unnamed protein product [Albugo candida]|uniref:Uncharacterized protein n=1 Tax=Albugo candida TaxID=65357 RepID=A0A024GH59_9STRA|nr:unnamed protein product [Albugo candida]|eukprot:CCI45851.1 unnamed protein product [Albugo candida]